MLINHERKNKKKNFLGMNIKNEKKLLNICFIILFSDFIFAQDLVIANSTNIGVENEEEVIHRTESKLEILEEKVDLCKDYFDRINSTYQWSMGIIFTVIIAFLGITGYNYHKNYKNELAKIKDKLEENYQNKINELIRKNSKSISENAESIENRLKRELLEIKFYFFDYQFKNEPSEKQKLSLSLKILNILSASNWGYSDWLFNEYFKYIEDCCSRKIYFNYSEVDDVKEMLSKLPERFENEKNKLTSVIDYDR